MAIFQIAVDGKVPVGVDTARSYFETGSEAIGTEAGCTLKKIECFASCRVYSRCKVKNNSQFVDNRSAYATVYVAESNTEKQYQENDNYYRVDVCGLTPSDVVNDG